MEAGRSKAAGMSPRKLESEMAYASFRGTGARFDVRPASPSYRASPFSSDHSHAPFAVFRKFAQGAGAAYLIATGAGNLGAAPAIAAENSSTAAASVAPVFDLTSLNGIAESLVTGGLTGPLQIAGAVLVFLAAGKCIARLVGLAAMFGVMFMYSQGVTTEEMFTFAGSFARRLSAAVEAFRAG